MADAHAKAAENAADIKQNGWRLTTKDWEARVLGVILPDGLHPVMYSSFKVEDDKEDGYAVWQETPEFRTACPLSSIVGLRVRHHYTEK